MGSARIKMGSTLGSGFDGTLQISEDAHDMTHIEHSKLLMVEFNQISPSSPQSAQHAANGHYDVESNVSKSSPSRHGDEMDASGEVSAPIDENLQQCMRMSTEVVSAGSELAITNIPDQININCNTVG